MTAVRSIYPSGIFAWTDRVNQEDIDFANDPNSLASEIISIENTLGANSQVERFLPVGNAITYPTVSARISDAMTNQQLPVVELRKTSTIVPNNTFGNMNTYKAVYDPYFSFNGSDLTIPADGWWYVSASQSWTNWQDGYSYMIMTLNGASNIVDATLFNWEFPGNFLGVAQPNQGPGAGGGGRFQVIPNATGPGNSGSGPTLRPITTSVNFQGLVHKNDRFSIFSENGTSNASHLVNNLVLKASMLRKVTGTFTSG